MLKKSLIILLLSCLSLYSDKVYNSVQNIIENEVPSQDVDNDGVPDYFDECPDSFTSTAVNSVGCPQSTFIINLSKSKKSFISFENELGYVKLNAQYDYLKVNSLDEELSEVEKVSKAKIDSMFGFTKNNIYKRATRYTLYFNKKDLDWPSKLKMKNIKDDIKNRKNAIIYIYGHTDTVGSRDLNFKVSKIRADRVKTIIESKNLKYLKLITIPMGEDDLKIKTKDNVLEPINKRVEVLIL